MKTLATGTRLCDKQECLDCGGLTLLFNVSRINFDYLRLVVGEKSGQPAAVQNGGDGSTKGKLLDEPESTGS